MIVKERNEIKSMVIFTDKDHITISNEPIKEKDAYKVLTLSTGKKIGIEIISNSTNYGHPLAHNEYVCWQAHPLKF